MKSYKRIGVNELSKKFMALILILVLIISVVSGCKIDDGKTEVGQEVNNQMDVQNNDEAKEIPTLGVGYMFSNHQTPLIVAAAKNEDFKSEGVYLKEIIAREKYILMSDEEELANIDVVVAENGGEVMTMMTQNHLQLGISSIGLPLTTIDQGHDMKVLGPIHADGIALVMGKDVSMNNFDDFVGYVEEKKEPIKIGYHSPANSPVILFEKAIKDFGLIVTENPEDVDADILLINLKGTANLIPALLSNEVDGWIGPSPFPELATIEETGKIVFDLRDLPPNGEWHDFPCCVFSANSDAIEKYPNEIEKFYELLTIASNFANNNKDETGKIVSEWMGVSEEAAKNAITKFTTDVNDTWLKNVNVTFDSLKDSDKFSGPMKDKKFDDIMDEVFNLTFANKVSNK